MCNHGRTEFAPTGVFFRRGDRPRSPVSRFCSVFEIAPKPKQCRINNSAPKPRQCRIDNSAPKPKPRDAEDHIQAMCNHGRTEFAPTKKNAFVGANSVRPSLQQGCTLQNAEDSVPYSIPIGFAQYHANWLP